MSFQLYTSQSRLPRFVRHVGDPLPRTLQKQVKHDVLTVFFFLIACSMAFFVGDLKGQNGHDSMGKQIGEQGRMWTHEYWRLTDMQAYMYLLLLVRISLSFISGVFWTAFHVPSFVASVDLLTCFPHFSLLPDFHSLRRNTTGSCIATL